MSNSAVNLSRENFLSDRQGKTFADVIEDPRLPFDDVLAFFSDADRQRRMEEAEIHHDRSPLAGVVRELEASPDIDRCLADGHPQRSKRLRQAVGVIIRMIMEERGWKKTGRKGSMGVRVAHEVERPAHNTGGLAFWFLRAERYERAEGMPYRSVKDRQAEQTPAATADAKSSVKRQA